jgi:tRNA-specific 2-thiouridylase
VDVDVPGATVLVGGEDDLLATGVTLEQVVWADRPVRGRVGAQCSAHGDPRPARVAPWGEATAVVTFDDRQRRVAVGQSVVLYEGDEVVGGGVATPRS